jgi:hypothetical protein
MSLQLQVAAFPEDDNYREWSLRLLVTRNGLPLNGLSEKNFSFFFPAKDGDPNEFGIDPLNAFDWLGSPLGPSGLDGLYHVGLLGIPAWDIRKSYLCIVTVKYSTQVVIGEAFAPFPHPVTEIDLEQAQALVSFYVPNPLVAK